MAQLTDLDQVRKRRARRRTIKGFVTLGIFALVVFGCAFLIRQVGDVNLRTAYSDIKEGLSTGEGYPLQLPGGNILAMGARIIGEALAMEIVENFLTTEFAGGRHQHRVDMLTSMDKERW